MADKNTDRHPPQDCWEWPRYINEDGYGVCRKRLAHRVVYEALIGPVPGLHLHHMCGNKACVNPAHLKPMTASQHGAEHMSDETRQRLRDLGAQRKAENTECPAGHEYTEANTYTFTRKDGRTERHCRKCRRDRWRERNGKTGRVNATRYNPERKP